MQYEIVTSKSGWATDLDISGIYTKGADEGLEDKVNSMIAQGWKPLGGVSMAVLYSNESNVNYSTVMFSQAMVKE